VRSWCSDRFLSESEGSEDDTSEPFCLTLNLSLYVIPRRAFPAPPSARRRCVYEADPRSFCPNVNVNQPAFPDALLGTAINMGA
jgi:hypothetical protein